MFGKPKGLICPLLNGPCVEHGCRWYVNLIGMHPQTGEHINQWDCAIPLLVVTNIEGSQQTRQAGAAIESFRNEMVRGNERSQALLAKQIMLDQARHLEHDDAA